MKISVIMPCHNAGRWIKEALRSVAGQQHPAHEVIVVNDASTDDSPERARRMDVVTRVIDVEHRNAAAARNSGIEASTGDWVAFLDADNRWHGDHLSRAVALLSRSDDCLYVAPPAPDEAEDTGVTRRREDFPLAEEATGLGRDDFVQWRWQCGWGFPTSGLVVRRDRLREVGGFDATQRRRHDFELVMRLVEGATWCASPWASWWSRPPKAGDISADRPACAYFALRALAINHERYAGGLYEKLLRREARKAVAVALRAGDHVSVRDTIALAKPYLPAMNRVGVGVLRHLPASVRHRWLQ